MGILFFSFGLLFVGLMSLAARAVLAIWIYKDAERRGMNPVLWCLLVIFTSAIIVLLVYLFAKKPSLEPKRGIGLLITGCILTGLSFILSIFVVLGLFGSFLYEIQHDPDTYDKNYEFYDEDGFDSDDSGYEF
ncbi:peptidase [Listeria valentina]|uniref:peptidase n=1 Tax=Listeria valentina TaxID=2705293 RepID=UPI001FE607C9|nr:peptidase [Listeria valentina]